MALEKEFALYPTLTSPRAYWRVVQFYGNKERLNYQVNVWPTKADAVGGALAIANGGHFGFVPDLSEGAPNFIQQAYNDIKARPEFAGAVDD